MFSSIPCVAIFFHSLIFCQSEIIVNYPHTNTGALRGVQSLTHHNCSWLTWLMTDQIGYVCWNRYSIHWAPPHASQDFPKWRYRVGILHQANIILNFHRCSPVYKLFSSLYYERVQQIINFEICIRPWFKKNYVLVC